MPKKRGKNKYLTPSIKKKTHHKKDKNENIEIVDEYAPIVETMMIVPAVNRKVASRRICPEEEDLMDSIYSRYIYLEHRYPVTLSYIICRQTNINMQMRDKLVDWLINIHKIYRMENEILHLCVHILDRMLERTVVTSVDNLKLLGASALLLSSKYEEIYPITVKDCCSIINESYPKFLGGRNRITVDDLLGMEKVIINTLLRDCGISLPTSYIFVRRILDVYSVPFDNTYTRNVVFYILELSLANHSMLRYAPSLQAACAVSLMRKKMSFEPWWPQELENYTNYNFEKDMEICEQDIMECFEANSTRNPNLYNKYTRIIGLTPDFF